MTDVFIEYSPSNLVVLHYCVFKLTGKKVKTHTSTFPTYGFILIEIRNDGVYLIQGAHMKEGTVPVSLFEALTYIRDQVFIQSLGD